MEEIFVTFDDFTISMSDLYFDLVSYCFIIGEVQNIYLSLNAIQMMIDALGFNTKLYVPLTTLKTLSYIFSSFFSNVCTAISTLIYPKYDTMNL